MPRFSSLTLGLFTLTLLVSALLLFLVQPMVGKMLLPLLGGAPAVWNTCMVFFQAVLLLGYLYAHVTTRMVLRQQMLLHIGVLLLPLLAIPITLNTRWLQPGEANPVLQVLTLLLVSVGLPFFVVSASAPLLQRWFANTGHAAAHDPYFLYGASNFGSIVALLGYPILLEPHLRLVSQSQLWTVGYVVLMLLTMACAGLVWVSTSPSAAALAPVQCHEPRSAPVEAAELARLSYGRCLRWVALAGIPSSLMLGATTYITTDIAAIPLLWVLPLTLYLLSFMLVFARLPQWVHQRMITAAPVLLLVLIFLMIANTLPPFWKTWMTIVLHLVVLFVVAMVCHGELAKNRPPAGQLTVFYLWISVGGVCGGLFNALVAPMIFTTVVEYPLALVLACFMFPSSPATATHVRSRWLDIGVPIALAALMLSLKSQILVINVHPDRLSTLLSLDPDQLNDFFVQCCRFDLEKLNVFLMFGVPIVLCYLCTSRSIRFGLSVSAIMLVTLGLGGTVFNVVYRERSFFGALRVEQTTNHQRLMHGTTLHGTQSRDRLHSQEPTTYYHRAGPIGQVLQTFEGAKILENIAIVGLGTGTLACYGEPGRTLTFYEIDPAVYRIASEPRYFTYLRDAHERGATIEIVLGDARLKLAAALDRQYGMMIIDAFSSDAIPVHLLTREALHLYWTKLAEGGLLVIHITNRHLNLAPVLGNLAKESNLAGLIQLDSGDESVGKLASWWVVLARRPQDLGQLVKDTERWKSLPIQGNVGVWADDFSNVLRVFTWQR